MKTGSYDKTPKAEDKDQVLLITLSTYSNLNEVGKGLVQESHTHTHNQEREMNHH